MSIRSLADFNGVRPPVGPVLAHTDTVTGRGTPAVDHVNEVGTFDGHTRGLSHGHGQQVSTRALGARVADVGAAAGQVVTYLESGVTTHSPSHTPALQAPSDGYYADSSETAGEWLGRGFANVGIGGAVDRDAFTRALLGRDPRTGAVLVGADGSAGRAAHDSTGTLSHGEWLTAAEAAQCLQMRESYVRRLLERGAPDDQGSCNTSARAYLAGNKDDRGRWRVARTEVERFAATRRQPSVVVGYDVTFSMPKSVSVLWAVLPPVQRAEIVASVDAAVRAGVAYLEDHAAFVRVKGKRLRSEGFIAASYLHGTSRALEPQLHRHVVIANMGAAAGIRVQTLDGTQLHLHQRTAAAVAGAELRHQLTERLGVRWTPVVRGKAEIEGVPVAALRAMSSRSAQINDLVAEMGNNSAAARQIAAYKTRDPKVPVAAHELRSSWRDRLAAAGFDRNVANRCLHRIESPTPLTEGDVERLNRSLATTVTEAAACFDRRDVLQHVADWGGDRLTAEDVSHLADGWLGTAAVVRVGGAANRWRRTKDAIRRGDGRLVAAPTGAILYTTVEMLELEARVRDAIARGATAGAGVVPPPILQAAIDTHPGLGADQVAMVRALTASGARIRMAVGPAGTGKTFALRVAAGAWQLAGFEVVGVAVGGTAAEVLGRATGVPSATVASLLTRLDTAHPTDRVLDARSVVLVDEASTIGNRELDRLVRHIERAGATLRLIGDPAQHSAVPAGGLWRSLVGEHRTATPTLTELRRQRGEEMGDVRRVLESFRDGHVVAAMQQLEAAGRVIDDSDPEVLLDRLVADWYGDRQRRRANPALPPSSMVAERHLERRELNRRARQLLAADGTLAGPALAVADVEFQAGDEVIARLQDRELRPRGGNRNSYVRNGTRGVVVAVRQPRRGGPSLLVDFEGRGPVEVPWQYLDAEVRPGVHGGLAHSYALTSHAAQGETYAAARHLATGRSSRAAIYVGLSRGVHDSRLYLLADGAVDGDAAHEHGLPVPEPDRDTFTALLQRMRVDDVERIPSELDPALLTIADLASRTALVELLLRSGDDPQAARAADIKAARIAARACATPTPLMLKRLGARPARQPDRERWDGAVGALAIHDVVTSETAVLDERPPEAEELTATLARRATAALASAQQELLDLDSLRLEL